MRDINKIEADLKHYKSKVAETEAELMVWQAVNRVGTATPETLPKASVKPAKAPKAAKASGAVKAAKVDGRKGKPKSDKTVALEDEIKKVLKGKALTFAQIIAKLEARGKRPDGDARLAVNYAMTHNTKDFERAGRVGTANYWRLKGDDATPPVEKAAKAEKPAKAQKAPKAEKAAKPGAAKRNAISINGQTLPEVLASVIQPGSTMKMSDIVKAVLKLGLKKKPATPTMIANLQKAGFVRHGAGQKSVWGRKADKPAKAEKAPKADKPAKAEAVEAKPKKGRVAKAEKPAKAPKAPKAPKAAKDPAKVDGRGAKAKMVDGVPLSDFLSANMTDSMTRKDVDALLAKKGVKVAYPTVVKAMVKAGFQCVGHSRAAVWVRGGAKPQTVKAAKVITEVEKPAKQRTTTEDLEAIQGALKGGKLKFDDIVTKSGLERSRVLKLLKDHAEFFVPAQHGEWTLRGPNNGSMSLDDIKDQIDPELMKEALQP